MSRDEKKLDTRRRLIDAAQRLFARKGMEACSVEEIAEDAGFSRGAFYSNFDSKEDIMRALIGEGFESDIAPIDSMRGSADRRSRGEAFGRIGGWFVNEPTNILWMLEFQLSAIRHPDLLPAYAAEHHKLRDAIADLLESYMRDAGRPDPASARKYCDLFLATLSGVSLARLIHGDAVPAERFTEFFEVILRGIEAS